MILSDIATIFDCPHSTAPDEGEGYPLIRTPNIGRGRLILDGVHRVCKDVYDLRNKRAIPQLNDIIFAREAPAGNAAVITEGQFVCLGQRTVLIRPNPSFVDAHYLVYYLLAPKQQIKLLGYSHGATVGHVNIPDIAKLPIELPELHVQRKIASIIEHYDNLIEVNNKRIKVLEQMAENLYKEWFVRFRFPGHETAEFENGIPKGWNVCRFSSIANVLSGGTPSTDHDEYYGGNIPFYTPKDSSDDYFVFDTISKLTEEGLQHCNSQLYPKNTIMITARGTVGNLNLLAKPMAMNQSCYALTSNTIPSQYFLFFLIKREILKLRKMASGGVFDTIIVSTFDHIKVTIPDESLIMSFDRLVSPILDETYTLLKQNRNLIRQRDLLLPRLMSGKLEV